MKNNKAKIFMIFSLLVITVIVSSTYAYYVWSTSDDEVTNIVAGIGAATVIFNGGSDINAEVSDKSKGIIKTISVKGDTEGLVFNMYLDITSIDDGLKDESFRYALYQGDTLKKEGDFSTDYLTNNTSTCTTNNTDHITLLTNESISTSETTYTLYIWIDGANYTNPSTMMSKTFNFKLHADGEGAVLKEAAAQYITNLYTNAEKTTVTNNSITYNYATSVSLMNDRLGGTTSDLDGGNIRYYGANPNNYIYFNCSDYTNQSSSTCETWRIIGIFGDKVKIIRDESIGTFAWDNKNASTGAETAHGKNDWTTARLMKLLNPSDYYTVDSNDNGYGQSLYWNSASGTCFSGQNNATKTCDFTSTGIKNDTTRNIIAEVTWNLGGHSSLSVYSNQIYTYERGTTVYSGRPTNWTGKIGLMYPSDYGYATDFNNCSSNLYSYNSSGCYDNDWLFNSAYQWLLTPNSSGASHACLVISTGFVNYGSYACVAIGVRPVLYLSSELGIGSGDGSESNPYRLSVS